MWGNSQSLLFQICLLFLSPSDIPIMCISYPCKCLISLDILGFFFPVFFLLLSGLRILLMAGWSSDTLLSCVQSTNEPIKGILHFCYRGFFNLSYLFFGSSLGFPSLCLHGPSVLVRCLLDLWRPFSVIIRVVLNSWSDNSSTPVYLILWLALSLQIVFLPFSMPFNVFLLAGHDTPGERKSW